MRRLNSIVINMLRLQHITGTLFTNAMLCKTEHAKIIAHTFSGVYSSIPPTGPRQRHLPFSNLKEHSTVTRVRVCALLNLYSCSVAGFASGVIRYSAI